MQEYNICFTTVSRPSDGSIPPLPENGGASSSSAGLAPLPVVIQGLVRKRREVKAQMKVRCRGVIGEKGKG
jgi:DNA polymerase alpha subunit A